MVAHIIPIMTLHHLSFDKAVASPFRGGYLAILMPPSFLSILVWALVVLVFSGNNPWDTKLEIILGYLLADADAEDSNSCDQADLGSFS